MVLAIKIPSLGVSSAQTATLSFTDAVLGSILVEGNVPLGVILEAF